MDEEQTWTGYMMAALAGGARTAAGAGQMASEALAFHLKRWPNGRIADRYRAENDERSR